MCRERAECETRYQDQLDSANRRLTELDAENRKLRDTKYELDSRVSELSHKLGAAEGSVKGLEEDNSRLKAQHKQAASDKHTTDILLNEAKAKTIALDEKVRHYPIALLHRAATRGLWQDIVLLEPQP